MNCPGFEVSMPDLLEPGASPRLRQGAERHLSECSRCRELWETVTGEAGGHDPRVILEVVEKTTGSACQRVRTLFEAKGRDERILQHLEDCPACKYWLLTKAWQEPGAGVAAFLSLRIPRLGIFERLLRRPRFGLEAAYAGTILFFLLASGAGGIPTWMNSAGQQLLNSTTRPGAAVQRYFQDTALEIRGEAGRVLDSLSLLPPHLESRLSDVSQGVAAVRRKGQEQWRNTESAVNFLQVSISSKLSDLKDRLSRSHTPSEPSPEALR